MNPRQRLRMFCAAAACLLAAAGAALGVTAATAAASAGATPMTASSTASGHGTSGNAGTSGNVHAPQPLSNADRNSGGANGKCFATSSPRGDYCSTRSGAPSLNGNGGGAAVGKPCAGCVGKADNKNPPGQEAVVNGFAAGGNRGYECDNNHGIGRTNPAHTGCVAKPVVPTSPPPVTPSTSPPVTPSTSPPVTPSTSPPVTPSTSAPVTVAPTQTVVPSVGPVAPAPHAVPAQQLPFTGASTAVMATVGALLVTLGTVLVVTARRRRRRPV